MTRHKDDWDVNARLAQIYLKVETTYPRQSDVEYQTAGGIRQAALQQFGGRSEHLDPQTNRLEKARKRFAN
jgi:hypothetical protein